MTAKEYLSQAFHLDHRIDSKIDQLESLNSLARKCTATLSGMPHSPNHGASTMAEVVAKIVDLQAEINADIDALVDLKREMVAVIKAIPNDEYQTVLEKRYLCFQKWEEIAVSMHFSIQYANRVHERALKELEKTEIFMKQAMKVDGS